MVTIVVIFSLGISIGTISAQSSYEIPSWVKGIAGFWAEGKITDSEFGEGLSFLIDSGVIKVPKIQELENKITLLENENNELQSKLSMPTQVCDESYPDVCIAPYPPDLDCGEIEYANFRVVGSDPHGFDRDNDGIGCES
jgi:hypothetical protein